MEQSWQTALTYLTILIGVGEVFSRVFGPTQEMVTSVVTKATGVKSKYKPAVNLGMSVSVVGLATVVLAGSVGTWEIIPGGVLVGIMTARVAAEVHDTKQELTSPETPEAPTG